MIIQSPIYLASASPRRYELLSLLQIPFERLLLNIDESPLGGERAGDYVSRLARKKAQAGCELAKEKWPVLGADTIVVLDEQILVKPLNDEHAASMLTALSGRKHLVITSIAFAFNDRLLSTSVITEVKFSVLSRQDIDAYIKSGEPMDKAGAYGIQGLGGCFVQSINGSYHSVVGLPLVETKELLTQIMAK